MRCDLGVVEKGYVDSVWRDVRLPGRELLCTPSRGTELAARPTDFHLATVPAEPQEKCGNKTGEEYSTWLHDLAPRLTELLTPDGSIVMELGNAWEPACSSCLLWRSKHSSLSRWLASSTSASNFYVTIPPGFPRQAQWVNVKRIRVKDSFTHIWGMSPTPAAASR